MEANQSLSSEEHDAILSHYDSIKNTVKSFSGARLIAISKRQPLERIQCLVDAGHKEFGENYLQEWQGKKDNFPKDLRWHFVGSVQSRKVKELIDDGIYCIQGIGSESSLKKLNQSQGTPPGGSFLQINLLNEDQKGGISLDTFKSWMESMPLDRIEGIMCIPPRALDEIELRKYFKSMKQLQEMYQLRELSMGMSADYKIALGEGATMVRVGSSLFGERRT